MKNLKIKVRLAQWRGFSREKISNYVDNDEAEKKEETSHMTDTSSFVGMNKTTHPITTCSGNMHMRHLRKNKHKN